MNFRKSSRGGVTFNPKNCIANFGPLNRTLKRAFRKKIIIWFSEIEGGGQGLFGIIPKIHPFWFRHPSLTHMTYVWLRTAFQFCHFFIFRLHLFFVAEVREQSLVAALSAVDALLVAKNNSHLGCPSIRQALCDCARISKHQANNICTLGTVAIYFIASRL